MPMLSDPLISKSGVAATTHEKAFRNNRPGLHSVAAARLIRGIDRGCCSSGKEREEWGTRDHLLDELGLCG
jgi:hypothetical protein